MAELSLIRSVETAAFLVMAIALLALYRKLAAALRQLAEATFPLTGCSYCPAVRIEVYNLSEAALQHDEEHLHKSLRFFRRLEAETPEDECWKLTRMRHYGLTPGLSVHDHMLPSECLEQDLAVIALLKRNYHQGPASRQHVGAVADAAASPAEGAGDAR